MADSLHDEIAASEMRLRNEWVVRWRAYHTLRDVETRLAEMDGPPRSGLASIEARIGALRENLPPNVDLQTLLKTTLRPQVQRLTSPDGMPVDGQEYRILGPFLNPHRATPYHLSSFSFDPSSSRVFFADLPAFIRHTHWTFHQAGDKRFYIADSWDQPLRHRGDRLLGCVDTDYNDTAVWIIDFDPFSGYNITKAPPSTEQGKQIVDTGAPQTYWCPFIQEVLCSITLLEREDPNTGNGAIHFEEVLPADE
jgi:hypothetical protein